MRAFSLTVQGKLGTSLRAPLWDRWQHMELPRMGRAVAEKGRGDSLVHEKEKGEQSVYIKVGKPHKVDFTTGTKVKQNEKSGHFN